MKVLITGVAGQVGSHVADLLLERGDEVVGIDNFATGRPEHLPKSEQFTFVEGSIADAALVEELFASHSPSVIVHAAASYKDPEGWTEDVATNIQGMVNLIRGCKSIADARLIYFQTALIYGVRPLQSPVQLSHPRLVDNSSYSITKGAAEDFLVLSGVDNVVFRLANVIGDRCLSGPLPTFYRRLSNDQDCFVTDTRRDFVFVGDLAPVVVRAVDGAGSGAYHFSSGTDVAIIDLYDAVAAALGQSDRARPELLPASDDNATSILLDPSRTFADFGALSFTPLSETVRVAVEYYREFGIESSFTHLKGADK